MLHRFFPVPDPLISFHALIVGRSTQGAVECEPHWQGTPGWNSDSDIVEKANYAVGAKLQGMMSFRIDNDHGPWPVHPAQPTYHGANLLWSTVKNATKSPNLGGFVLNTYISLHDPFSPGQICPGLA